MRRTKSERHSATPPIRTNAHRLLAAKRGELASAELALKAARGRYDADAVMSAQQRIAALRDIVGDLTARHAGELEEEAQTRARRWLEEHSVAEMVCEVSATQEKALAACETACSAIAAEGQARERLREAMRGRELLLLRWPDLLHAAPASPAAPGSLDYGTRVVTAATLVNDRPIRPLAVPGVSASGTPEQHRCAVLRELYRVVDRPKKHGHAVPAGVHEIIEAAPRPPEIEETDAESDRRERAEARRLGEAAEIGSLVDDYKRGLGLTT